MNILLTGGAGFIGSHIAERLLARGDRLTILDDFNNSYDPTLKRRNAAALAAHPAFPANASLLEIDITDTTATRAIFQLNRFDAIIHIAARAGVRLSIQQPLLYTRVNITGTHNLLELAREFDVHKFIFASSSSVYGINQKTPFSEEDPIFQPISPYAATKLAGEALTHVYHHLYGLDITCLRFFTVYGPRQRPDLAIRKFTTAITKGQPIEIYGDGTTRRDYTYIDDILQGVFVALDRSLGYQVINLGESRTVELRELVRLIEKELGTTAKFKSMPLQPGDVPITCADITKARHLLDYNPQVPIEEGITRFVRWYKSQT